MSHLGRSYQACLAEDLYLPDQRGLNPERWGPPFWDAFHITAAGYPTFPQQEQVTWYRAYFESLRVTLPCEHCRKSYVEITDAMPLDDNVMANRDSLFRWTHAVHTAVNHRVQRSSLSIAEAANVYMPPRERPSTPKGILRQSVMQPVLLPPAQSRPVKPANSQSQRPATPQRPTTPQRTGQPGEAAQLLARLLSQHKALTLPSKRLALMPPPPPATPPAQSLASLRSSVAQSATPRSLTATPDKSLHESRLRPGDQAKLFQTLPAPNRSDGSSRPGSARSLANHRATGGRTSLQPSPRELDRRPPPQPGMRGLLRQSCDRQGKQTANQARALPVGQSPGLFQRPQSLQLPAKKKGCGCAGRRAPAFLL